MNNSYRRKLSGHIQIQSKIFLGAFAAACAMSINAESFAATGSSWAPKDTWTADDSSASSQHRRSSRDSSGDVSPFSPGSNNFALDLGQVFLMGDLGQYADSIGTQLHYTYGVSDMFGFDSSIGYSEHSDGGFAMTTLLTGMRFNLSWYDKIIPYGVFGLGFYRPSYRDATGSASGTVTGRADAPNVSAILFGVHLGPGIDLELSKNFFFGASVTFHNMFGTDKKLANGTPLSVGGTYTSFFLHLGFTL
jgi:hypothetical protein